jgi:hypothetical protein
MMKLLGISHVKARPDKSELDLRFAFEDRSPMVASVSFDTVKRLARMFDQLASAVRSHAELDSNENSGQAEVKKAKIG